jgi:alanine racemase
MNRDRVWVEVNLNNLGHNIHALKERIGPGVKLLPLLKANAYGCGIAAVGKTALDHGADWLGVELVEEALDLRNAGVTAPILLMGPTNPWQAETIVEHDLRATVRDEETLIALASCASRSQKVMPIQIELDTGLHRLGLQPAEGLNLIQRIQYTPQVRLEGVWTHFASSDDVTSSFTAVQFDRYRSFIQKLEQNGVDVPIQHVSNSAAFIPGPELRLNMVRCGETVYGYAPRRDLHNLVDLRPVVSWKTRVIRIQPVAAGESVSYRQTWFAKRDSLIGTISVGYADGFKRSFAQGGYTLVRGGIAPITGTISMQMAMIDLTDIPGVELGDEVVLMGQQGDRSISAYDLAGWAGTGEFEILVSISARIPRYYVSE